MPFELRPLALMGKVTVACIEIVGVELEVFTVWFRNMFFADRFQGPFAIFDLIVFNNDTGHH